MQNFEKIDLAIKGHVRHQTILKIFKNLENHVKVMDFMVFH